MLSENAIKNRAACRRCWMCRHLCPIGLKTGRENTTPRAKGLMLDLVDKGREYSPSMAADMYECFLCGACASGCETGFDSRIFIREARTWAVAENMVPVAVTALLDSLKKYGNIFGVPTGKNTAAAYAADKADILFYAGPTATTKTPEMVTAAAKLLVKAGVPFIAWENEPVSGAELADIVGHVDETVESVKPLLEKIKALAIKKVVVLDPYQAKVMRHDYPEWGLELGAEVVTATAFLAELVLQGKLSPTPLKIKNATYHDTSRLARDLDETQPARDLLAAMGIDFKEMFLNLQRTRCPGDEITAAHSPAIVELTVGARWDDVERCGATTLIAACPTSFHLMDVYRPEGKVTANLYELMAEACGA
ncbi:MAG: (Fe-S)-binding protein [Planctomycetaceae bacterium]|nr:(Fe-S)-binding protein [Planctomycetaceae bacterium]